ncbi:AAA family ATPase [Cystobacter ferrugineus]|uniref:ATPase AAA-type core domain-containing protein n=1 Tax=Cystobacter ferrugineus TaxID=83449 RepID=A0A1L9BHD6_9BACT|nr:AAA family ATPase [Cystobacter ferrugineus]OJH41692.1 hypothetical protein BON30_00115 [Cystobacter ferrugineus]
MLTSLRVTGFRNFASLSMEGLTRVNLLVGENNAGKTSVLEAAEILLLAQTSSFALARGPMRRGENVPPRLGDDGDDEPYSRAEIYLGNLFHGHETSPGNKFELHGETSRGPLSVSCSLEIAETEPIDDEDVPVRAQTTETLVRIVRMAETGTRTSSLPLELSRATEKMLRQRRMSFEFGMSALQFVGTASPRRDALHVLWDGIVLTPEEQKVIEAMQLIQSDIERIAWLSYSSSGTDGFFVKLQHSDRRVPLGSMGEGIKRLLVLALNLVKSAGGYLLVDEIDTGLHYSVMVKMWKLVVETARRLDIQVFATTHSLDCIQALAGLYESDPDVREEISLHRIEKGAPASIRYSADEILNAAQRQVEVR